MDKLEKVERLRERANVTYEEAKDALEQAGDDLLEAMVLLERMGKTKGPERSTYSTNSEEQPEYIRVQEKVEEQEQSDPNFGHSLGSVIRTILRLIKDTSFVISRKEKTVFEMPSWVAVLIIFFSWHVTIPLMLIALFFGFRYSLYGQEEDTREANDILNKAGEFADDVESGMRRENNH